MSNSSSRSLDAQIGAHIREIRQKAQYSEIQAAARLGIPLSDYEAIETGTKRANATTLHRLAAILNTSLADIYSGVIE